MPRFFRLLVMPVALTALTALAACGDDDSSSSSTSAAPSTTEGGATTTGGSDSPTTTSGSSGELEAALLTAEDIGEGFQATTVDPDDPDETTPCGTPSVQKAYPPEDQAGVDIDNTTDELFFNQRIFLYPDESTAEAALASGKEGLACEKGTAKNDDGTETSFDLQEVSTGDDVGERAFAYSGTVAVGGQSFPATFIAIQQGKAISTLTFLSTAGKEGPEIGPIAAAAADKLATVG